MAVFNINTDFSDAQDIKQVKGYLYRLNDQLQYMFSNMTAEDNLSTTALNRYLKNEQTTVELQIAMNGISASVTNSATKSEIRILEGEISAEVSRATGAEGTLQSQITQNAGQIALKVNSADLLNSSLTIKPAAISIESGGSIDIKAGSTFTVSATNFSIDQNGNVYMTGSFEQLNALNDLVEITSQDTGGLLGWTAGSIRLKDIGIHIGAVAETNIILNGSGNIVANDYYIYDENGSYEIEGKTYSSIRDLLGL